MVRWQSLCRERAVLQRQPETRPHIDQRFSKRVDQRIIVIGRRRDAQPLGATRDGRIVDRLDVDAVLGEQKIARCPVNTCTPRPRSLSPPLQKSYRISEKYQPLA